MQSIRIVTTTKTEQFFSNKNRPVTRMSHSVRTTFLSPSEKSLWNPPTICSTSWPQEPYKNQSRDNRMTFDESNTGAAD